MQMQILDRIIKNSIFWLVAVVIAGGFGCLKVNEPPNFSSKIIFSNDSIQAGYRSGTVTTQVNRFPSGFMAFGHCWSISPNPEISGSKTSISAKPIDKKIVSQLSDLMPGTTYQVSCYILTPYDTIYSSPVTLATTPLKIPSLTTRKVESITITGGISGGEISFDGGSEILSRGVCWSTFQNPTLNDNQTYDGTGTGTYTSSITGLTPYTTYYVRAYATNIKGPGYGNELSFKTNGVTTLTTNGVTGITVTTAVSGGNITDDGGLPITARGVCWSTTQNPEVTGSKTVDGTGAGSFRSNLTGLTGNTTYFVRAYATNSSETYYGGEESFSTREGGTFTDTRDRDTKVYNWVLIGTQRWMTENLAYLPAVSPSEEGSEIAPYYYVYGYEGSTSASAKGTANYTTHGVLYNWQAALIACPDGWHLPTDSEWTVLTEYLTSNGYGYEGSGDDIGKSMAAASGWLYYSTPGTIGNDQGSNNSSGFAALPGGYRNWNEGFKYLGQVAHFWSASDSVSVSGSYALDLNLYYLYYGVYRNTEGKKMAYSVRCLRNN